MIKLLPEEFIKLMIEKEYKVFREDNKPFNLNIIGYRNKFGRPNYFDDTIAVYYEENGQWISKFYAATTLPGYPYLRSPVTNKGAAILVPGQYLGSYQLGVHKGKYTALVQKKSVRIYRDNNRDNVYDTCERTIECGMFGINIHRASLYAKIVGLDSAGCQVIQNSKEFDEFIDLCFKARAKWGNNLTYTLVEI